jgi:hypothetical protein
MPRDDDPVDRRQASNAGALPQAAGSPAAVFDDFLDRERANRAGGAI